MPIGTSLAPYAPLVEGKEIGGEIVDFRVQQKTDFDTQRPLFFVKDATTGRVGKGFESHAADGTPNRPICDWVFTVDTGVEDENGDTERRIFLDPRTGQRGSDVEGKRGGDAIAIALKKAKAHRVGLEIGGTIFITRGPKMAPRRGEAQCVTYTARYEPPAGGVGTGEAVDEVPWLVGGERYSSTPKFGPAAQLAAMPSAATPVGDADASPATFDSILNAVSTGAAAKARMEEQPPF